jgi:hypothetical protein
MKKFSSILFALLFFNIISAQWDFSTGMGINMSYSPGINDYIMSLPTINKMESFNVTAEFAVEATRNVSENWQLGVEYALSLYSFNSAYAGGIGNYTLEYSAHKPSLLLFYIYSGKGYTLKFGGGAGYRSYKVVEKIHSPIDHTTNGIGLVAKIEGHTLLSGNLYALLGGDLRQDFPGSLSIGDISNSGDKVSFNTFNIGIKIGVSYFLR